MIVGSKGELWIGPAVYYQPEQLKLNGEVIEAPFADSGYKYQVMEVHHCLREGKLESNIMPLDETRAIMQTLDTIRAQWGLKYPMED